MTKTEMLMAKSMGAGRSLKRKDKMNDDQISRKEAIDAADRADYTGLAVEDVKKVTDEVVKEIKKLPSAQPEPMTAIDWSEWEGRDE